VKHRPAAVPYAYSGRELALFGDAQNWKRYFGRMIRPFLGEEVLEVGAGLGSTGRALCSPSQKRWLCLEPDGAVFEELERRIRSGQLPPFFQAVKGTTAELPADAAFTSILYVDVLEHIQEDAAEILRVSKYLRPGGFLIILAPAHPFLFSPFDAAIGHYRRYTRQTLLQAIPPVLNRRFVRYLDSVGFLASLGNRLLLRKAMPSLRQIHVWDGLMVAASRRVDWVLAYRVGKSLLGVWQRPRGE
jgi:SAM-dependent methyltransferase